MWLINRLQEGAYVELLSSVFWVILSITLHELAHGWAALWQGDDTPRRLNRMTANPLVHMGPWSLLIFALIGIAWGLMPVDPSKFRWRRKGRIMVAAAGPAMNLALAISILTIAALWINYAPEVEPLRTNLRVFLLIGGVLNLVLAIFNLLPLPPLDGSQILAGMSIRFYRLLDHPQMPMIGLFILLALFISGIFDGIFLGAAMVAGAYLGVLDVVLP